MPNRFYTILTDIGAAKIAEAPITGEKVTITDFAVGDGMGGYYEPSQTQTALKNEVYRGKIDSYTTQGQQIKISGIIPAAVGGFTVREVGAFDKDGDLIAVANTSESEKPLPIDGIAYKMEIGITISINGTPDCIIEIDDLNTAKLKKMIQEARKEIINNLDPPGTIKIYAGNGPIPAGYLLCDGSAVSRRIFAALFADIGTLYGEGDGATTFNLPDLTARFVEGGAIAGQVKAPGLPNITAGMGHINNYFPYGNTIGAFSTKDGESRTENAVNDPIETSKPGAPYLEFDASRANSIYGNSDTVQPAAVTMRYIIRY